MKEGRGGQVPPKLRGGYQGWCSELRQIPLVAISRPQSSSAEVWYVQAYKAWPYGDFLWPAVWIIAIHTILPLPLHFLFLAQNYFKFEWLDQWKIQKNIYPAPRLVKEVVLRELFNHFFLTPLMVLIFSYPTFFMVFNIQITGRLPNLPIFLAQIAFMIVMNETGQYWVHRLLHVPILYKYIHAQHHRFVTPISFAAEYSHPVEMLLANDAPTFLGASILSLFMDVHMFTMMTWVFIRVYITLESHSGFAFPWSPIVRLKWLFVGPDGHDWHHSHNKGNYGVLWFWDALCGTNSEYLKWLEQKEFESRSKTVSKVD